MSDRWETRKEETERRVKLAVAAYRKTTPTGRPLPDQTWDIGPMGTVDQPLDPDVHGLGILYAIEVDDDPQRYIVVRFRDGSSDYFSVEALEIETSQRSSFYGHWHDFYSTSVRVPLPKDLSSFGSTEAEVSMTGGGTRDPHKVGIAARVLAIASFLAMHLDRQMETAPGQPGYDFADAADWGAKQSDYVDVEDDVRDSWTEDPAPITADRFHTLARDKWVVAEMQPKNGRKRTIRGDIVSIEYQRGAGLFHHDPQPGDIVRMVTIEDKAGRHQIVDVPAIKRLITGGEDGITLVIDGEMAPDYRLARR